MVSRGRNDEGGGEVFVDDECGEGVVLSHLVFLSIDLLSKQLVEVDCVFLPFRGLSSHRLHVQVLLKVFSEPHNHVQAVAVEDLEDEQMRSVGGTTDCNGALKDALLVEMSSIDKLFNLGPLVFYRDTTFRLVDLCKNFEFLSRLAIHLVE